jgi:hypothetical protein
MLLLSPSRRKNPDGLSRHSGPVWQSERNL